MFRWRDGNGWLVFASTADASGDIRADALSRSAADGAVACISLTRNPADADQLLDDVEDLGAPSGYLVDVNTEDDNTLRDRIGEAGVVIIQSDMWPEGVKSSLMGAALEGVEMAYQNGAVILLEGSAAAAFGQWMVQRDGSYGEGLAWLENALILPDAVSVADSARSLFQQAPHAVALGIGRRSALVFGPTGELEVWGDRQVTVALGTTGT